MPDNQNVPIPSNEYREYVNWVIATYPGIKPQQWGANVGVGSKFAGSSVLDNPLYQYWRGNIKGKSPTGSGLSREAWEALQNPQVSSEAWMQLFGPSGWQPPGGTPPQTGGGQQGTPQVVSSGGYDWVFDPDNQGGGVWTNLGRSQQQGQFDNNAVRAALERQIIMGQQQGQQPQWNPTEAAWLANPQNWIAKFFAESIPGFAREEARIPMTQERVEQLGTRIGQLRGEFEPPWRPSTSDPFVSMRDIQGVQNQPLSTGSEAFGIQSNDFESLDRQAKILQSEAKVMSAIAKAEKEKASLEQELANAQPFQRPGGPPIPAGLEKFIAGAKPGGTIKRTGEFNIPSGQLMAQMTPTQAQQLVGLGQFWNKPVEDVWFQAESMLPKPIGARRWKPARQVA